MAAEAPPPPDLLAGTIGVGLSLGGQAVLEGVDLAVSEGEIVTLIGPNGSGKTTLVRVVLGLLEADRGRVYRRGGVRVGYMPQRVSIDETLPLTVARFLSLSGPAPRDRMTAALAEVRATRLARSPIQTISGGELQRVLLARALLREPDLLVLDEPVQGVDITGQGEVYDLITEIRDRRGCGVLMVSHDLHLVMASTDTVVCLNHHVCCTGHPETVRRDPEYLALFGPLAEKGLAVYSHEHDHHHDVSGEVVPRPPAVESDDAGAHSHG